MKLVTSLVALVVLFTSTLVSAETYAVDPVHSFVTFRIKHLNTSYTYGRFNSPEGAINYDAANPEKTTLEVTVKVANVDTNNAARDNHLKSPTFFNVKEFPTITFKSNAAQKKDDTHLEITGDLTLLGVTKSITLNVEITGTGKDMKGNPLVGFETTLAIKRSDYGMKEMLDAVGDDVSLAISIEAGKK